LLTDELIAEISANTAAALEKEKGSSSLGRVDTRL
jgi:hypothetical protein